MNSTNNSSNHLGQTITSSIVSRKISTERIAAQLDSLGPLPAIAMEVVRLTNSEHSDAKQLEDKISQDPVITAKVFKMANSAFYCPAEPHKTLQGATSRLGMNTVKNIVLSTCTGNMMAQPLQLYPYDGFGLWKHSLCLAISTMQLAEHMNLRKEHRDNLFLSGMMHDIGKMIANPLLTEAITYTGVACTKAEQAIIGIDHAHLGVEIAEFWNLPDFACEVIKNHHYPEHSAKHENLVAAVHIIDYVLNKEMIGLDQSVVVDSRVSPCALEILKLHSNDIEGINEIVNQQLPDIIKLCDSMM